MSKRTKISKLPRVNIVFVTLLSCVLFFSCKGGSSFTGASINADTKTFQVEMFLNRASIVQPILASE